MPGWLEKCWLSAQSFAFGEPGGMRRPRDVRTGESGWWMNRDRAGAGRRKGAREPCCRERIGEQRQGGGGRETEGTDAESWPVPGAGGGKGGAMEATGTGGRCIDGPGRSIRVPETSLPRRSRRAGWSGSLRTGQTFRMGPQAAPASDAKSPAGIGSDAGGALRSVIRYCGVSEGAQSGARSSKAV